MKRNERILIAGAGAVVPMAVSFLTVDARNIFDDLSIGVIFGLALRGIILFGLGAITGLLNQRVSDRKTLFQLGIAAPALISGLIVSAPATNGLNAPCTDLYRAMPTANANMTTPISYMGKAAETSSTSMVVYPWIRPHPSTSIEWPTPSTIDGVREKISHYKDICYSSSDNTLMLATVECPVVDTYTDVDKSDFVTNMGRGFFGKRDRVMDNEAKLYSADTCSLNRASK